MDAGIAAVMGAAIAATIALYVAAISTGGLNRIDRLSNIIAKLDEGEERNALVEMRSRSIQRYIQRDSTFGWTLFGWGAIVVLCCVAAGVSSFFYHYRDVLTTRIVSGVFGGLGLILALYGLFLLVRREAGR
ncbi:hypothetical protein ACFVU2_18920 [Leifsonia sp. NPDC058194]|uniref:hypothetical protein n=1 Tax=Leifsonia sp. NPDC058194 TaxID=3346374 RepID=UPI0036DD8DDC